MIDKLEILVDPFGDINHLSNVRGEILMTTSYNAAYTEANERSMMTVYLNEIMRTASHPGSFMLFVPHSRASRGELHNNVKPIMEAIIDCYEDRYHIEDITLKGKELPSWLRDSLSSDTVLSAWGEHLSGCVLYELLQAYKGINGNYPRIGEVIRMISNRASVDFIEGFERPWAESNHVNQDSAYSLLEKRYKRFIRDLNDPLEITGHADI
jgi:hypothetical protein